jgi:two-component system, NarL family, sensor histidine kinase LiaS
MLSFFRSLRGKLTLTYTLVTVLALLALEVIALGLLVFVFSAMQVDKREYLEDIVYTLSPQARQFLQAGEEDLVGLQEWLDRTYASGFASMAPQGWLDSPAAPIVPYYPMYVLSTEGLVLAQTPREENSLIGQRYTAPDNTRIERAVERGLQGWFDAMALSTNMPGGDVFMAAPVFQQGMETQTVLAVILVTVEPPPPLIFTVWPFMLAALLATAVILLVGVAPFGMLFGYIMSRGLTRRLSALTAAADAWSEGNFHHQPQDRSRDEIGYLGLRMRHMAERIQSLVQTQQELAMMDERNRLARELHDTVKQEVFATLMQVRAAKNLMERDSHEARKHLEEAESLIKNSQQELGLMITELRPAALEGQGLPAALQTYLTTWSQHALIPSTLQVQNQRTLPLEVEQALYRVAQEALANVARHSRASAANLRLVYEPTRVCLTISDNGVGFDSRAAHKAGFGLRSMQERVSALSGKLEVHSSPEDGTTLHACIPLGAAAEPPVGGKG